jgi:hypothetical protein
MKIFGKMCRQQQKRMQLYFYHFLLQSQNPQTSNIIQTSLGQIQIQQQQQQPQHQQQQQQTIQIHNTSGKCGLKDFGYDDITILCRLEQAIKFWRYFGPL